MIVVKNCLICGIQFRRCISKNQKEEDAKFCSRKCVGEHFKTALKGENNPNFGKRWGIELRQKASEFTRKRMESPLAREQSAFNRGRIFSEQVRQNMSNARRKIYEKHGLPKHLKNVSTETKAKIGKASSERWKNKEYRDNQRKVREEKYKWVKLENLDEYKFYFRVANFLPREWLKNSELHELYKIHGIWHYVKNPLGKVRDHSYSRRSGFQNGVFPEILRHPANCTLLSQSENISKGQKGGKDSDSITLEKLFSRIINYEYDYIEQAICLEKIQEYEKGNRYDQQQYLAYW